MEEQYQDFSVYVAKFKTLLTEKYLKNRNWKPPNENHVLALIPGTILDVKVKKGADVKAGETLLILDAMKMENCITMPFDGRIANINVNIGDVVPKNHLLVEIDPS